MTPSRYAPRAAPRAGRRWRYSATGAVVGPPPAPNTADFFVTTDAAGGGDGSYHAPWTAAEAFANPAIIGETLANGIIPRVWFREGVYAGTFSCGLSGLDTDLRVQVRAFPLELVEFDGDFAITGMYGWYRDLVFMLSDPKRWTHVEGSDPDLEVPGSLPRYAKELSTVPGGGYNRYHHCVVRDMTNGIGESGAVPGLEVVGTRVFNGGWASTDRGHGHGLYVQNNSLLVPKRVTNTAVWNHFAGGLKFSGSDSSAIRGIIVDGTAAWDQGGPLSIGEFDPVATAAGHPPPEGETYDHGFFDNTHMTGTPNMGGNVYRWSSFYGRDASIRSMWLGENGLTTEGALTLEDVFVQGAVEWSEWGEGSAMRRVKIAAGTPAIPIGVALLLLRHPSALVASALDLDHVDLRTGGSAAGYGAINARVGGSATAYSTNAAFTAATGWNPNGSLATGTFSGADVIVRPDPYDDAAGIIHCWNRLGVATLNVDLSDILEIGDTYQIHHAYQSIHDEPVVSGTYDGGLVALPQEDYVAPVPTGMTGPVPSAAPYFNVFFVRPGDLAADEPTLPPVAAGTFDLELLAASFTDASTTERGTITSRTLDWGDGTVVTVGAGETVEHTYADAGFYDWTYTVVGTTGTHAIGDTAQAIEATDGTLLLDYEAGAALPVGSTVTAPADRMQRGSGGSYTLVAADTARSAHYRLGADGSTLVPTLLVEPARTTLVWGTRDYTAPYQWNANNAATLTAVASGDAVDGDHGQIAFTANSASIVRQDRTIAGGTASKTFTVTADVKTASGTAAFRLESTHNGVANGPSTDKTATTAWQRFSFTRTNSSSAGSGTQGFGFRVGSALSAVTVQVRHLVAEEGSVVYDAPIINDTTASRTQSAESVTLPGVTASGAATLYLRYFDYATGAWADAATAYTSDTPIALTTGRAYSHVAVITGTRTLVQARADVGVA